jgi:hypothetical protein
VTPFFKRGSEYSLPYEMWKTSSFSAFHDECEHEDLAQFTA